MNDIFFFNEDIEFQLNSPQSYANWIKHVVQQEGRQLRCLNYIFCSDEYLLNINTEYLDHHYYTDIITFNNSDDSIHVEADLFISIDRIKDNAQNLGVTFQSELRRVMVHGVLHLVGYDDKSKDDQLRMREKENAYLSLPQFQIM